MKPTVKTRIYNDNFLTSWIKLTIEFTFLKLSKFTLFPFWAFHKSCDKQRDSEV